MKSNQFSNLLIGCPKDTLCQSSFALLRRTILLLFFLLPMICLQGVYYVTVNCPNPANVHNYDNIPEAIAEAVYPTGADWDHNGEVNLKIYGQTEPYTLTESIQIPLYGNTEVTNLTIEGDNNPDQNCIIIGAPNNFGSTPGRVFRISMYDQSHLTVKHLKFVCISANEAVNGTAAINITFPAGLVDFEYNTFETSGSALYSSVVPLTGFNFTSTINIRNNFFYRTANFNTEPDFDTIHFTNRFTGTEPIHFNIEDNHFYNALIPIDLDIWCQTTSIARNHFTVPERAYTNRAWNTVRVYASPQIAAHNGLSQLDFYGNDLTNVALDIGSINTTIHNNLFKSDCTPASEYAVMFFVNDNACSYLTAFSPMLLNIENNTVFDVSNAIGATIHLGDYGGQEGTILGSYPINATIVSNSIFSNGFALLIEKDVRTSLARSHVINTFRNNLIQMPPNSSTMIFRSMPLGSQITPVHQVNIDHCWFTEGYPTHVEHFICDATCGSGDPFIDLDLENNTYSLQWNENQKSPLIMAGVSSDNNPIQVSRTTAFDMPDIGRVQYDAQPHERTRYGFPKGNQRGGVRWLSFPTIDRIFTNPANQNYATTLFNPLAKFNEGQGEPDVYHIQWKPVEADYYLEMSYNPNLAVWQNVDNDLQVIPQQGYKFIMNQALQTNKDIIVKGTYPALADNPIQLRALRPDPSNPGQFIPNDNWIGYFRHDTVSPLDAFSTVINDLYFIQTQKFTMCRASNYDKSQAGWVMIDYPNSPNGRCTLSYGDMVNVRCYSDGEFHWSSGGAVLEPYEKEDLEHFSYIEKTEYVPFYIDFTGTDLPKEVGLYINDICKGGAKVIGKLVEVPGYILEGIPENPNIEFRLFFANKANDQIPTYCSMDINTGEYTDKPIDLSTKQDYYRVKIDTSNNQNSPIPQIFISNYPNPFSPSTNIEYYVPKDSDISIDIFNVKGQKVNTLVSAFKVQGVHQITWEGTDNNGKKLSCGIYFARLHFQNQQTTQKMILIK